MAEKRIEYAVMDHTGTVQLFAGTDRERAISMTKRFNLNRDVGFTFTAVERTVTVSDWKPTNTGIVGPHQGGSPE